MRDYGSEISALAAQLMAVMRDARKEITRIEQFQKMEEIKSPKPKMTYEESLELMRKSQIDHSLAQSMTMSDLCDGSMRPEYQKEGCE